jgi:structure-specific recognition protein 1
MIKSHCELTNIQGDWIVSFDDLPCLVPRGRYEVDMASTFMRFRGKTYDYKILYSSIVRLFLLPKPDEVHILFIIAMDPPLRQGQTRYPYLIMQFARDETIEISLNISE